MAQTANKSFAVRDWFGLTVGICWGLVLGHFFASEDMTGPWLAILFGPPLVLLIAPARPILSWQLPIAVAVLSGAFLNRAPEDTAGTVFLEAVGTWLMCSVFSSPWALIFYYRSRRLSAEGASADATVNYVGVGLLVFLACAVTVVGFAGLMYSESFGHSGSSLRPLDDVLVVTAGIALCVISEFGARRLKIQHAVRASLELVLLLGALVGITEILDVIVEVRSADPAMATSSVTVLCFFVAGGEALAVLIWLTLLGRKDRKAALEA